MKSCGWAPCDALRLEVLRLGVLRPHLLGERRRDVVVDEWGALLWTPTRVSQNKRMPGPAAKVPNQNMPGPAVPSLMPRRRRRPHDASQHAGGPWRLRHAPRLPFWR